MKFNFTDRHKETLSRYHHYFKQYKQSGAIRISSYVVDQLAKVYDEATGKRMNKGCGACVGEAFKLLYRNYEEQEEAANKATASTNDNVSGTNQAQPGSPGE